METTFVIYVLYAVVALIWSSLNEPWLGLRHLVISAALLKEGAFLGTTPIVIELRPARPTLRTVASIPGSLVISRAKFSSLVRWAPPGATLVFCEHGEGRHLDWKVEQVLLKLGISAVYWLDLRTNCEPLHTSTESSALSAKS
jgi:hypothetical protein